MAIIEKLKTIFKRNKRLVMAYKQVFNIDDPSVKIVLKDMCVAHNVFDGGFDPDPYVHAFNGGERNAVMRIMTVIGMTMEDIQRLSEEEL